MKIYNKYTQEANSYFLECFKDAFLIEEKSPENNFFWQLTFKVGSYTVYINSEYGYIGFQVLTASNMNLSIRSRNAEVFSNSLKTNIENIHLIIDFLFNHKDEIFKE
ncbi:hypothetical protein [uncultured Sunxiuqinia sp.]|uniref:hypothetical protein n=1 Tax=uncultured Sunxiuqinia sp. TaxID=1573825 RepID=UPI002AA842B2|nr:hypothetical protein [uncultured Sunxiuqinia sp.]